MKRAWLLAMLLLASLNASAAEESRRVAVLPLTGDQTTLPRSAIVALEESIRTKAGDVLRPLGYNVMTSETTFEVLRENGVDMQKVCESSCALEAGREMKARFIIGGQITSNDGWHSVFIRFIDVTSGTVLSSIKLKGQSAKELDSAFDASADDLFAKARIQGDDAIPGTIVITANVEDADVTIDGRPQAQRVGAKLSASFDLKPGTHQVKVSKVGYFEFLSQVEVRSRDRQSVKAELVEEKAVAAETTITGGVTTLVAITTDPKGAIVRIDGKPVGRSPLNTRLAPGEHTIEAQADLYLPAKQKVQVQSGEVKTVSLKLDPSFGRLEVTASPSGALVYLDDRQQGTASPTLIVPRLTSGTYRLRLTLADHYDHVQQITIRNGGTEKIQVPAMRPSVGSLRIASTPSGAQVILDGVERGRTPLLIDRLAGGVHELRLVGDEYKSLVETVTAIEGREQSLSFTLEAGFALVSLTSTPPGARVFVNGREVGTAPLPELRVPEGEAVLRVEGSSESYRPWEKRVTVTAGRPLSLQATLQPILGRLLVVTTPPGAAVRIDGKSAGTTPLALPEMLAGSHEVEVSLEEHRTERRTVQVQGEREKVVELSLVELLPAEKAAKRMAEWEAQTAGSRRLAWVATGGTAVLAGLGVWQLLAAKSHAQEKTQRYADYQDARVNADVAWGRYTESRAAEQSARTRAMLLGIGAGAAAIGTGWLWLRVPARPTIQVAGSGGEIGLTGEW
jgi:hypothetical protein